MKVQAIIVAAGDGVRLKADRPKGLVPVGGRALLSYSLEAFEQCPLISGIIVVAHPEYIDDFRAEIERQGFKKISRIIGGGRQRFDSVSEGLAVLDQGTKTVVIHDGARPFVSQAMLGRALDAAVESAAVIAAVPMVPTVKRVDLETMTVEATLDRTKLWEVQTPQVFRRELIERAHRERQGAQATDDAFLVELLGEPVKVVRGEHANIKVTTPEDILMAEMLLERINEDKK